MAKILSIVILGAFLGVGADALASDPFREIVIPLHASTISLDPTYAQDSQSLWVARQVNCQLFRLKGKSAEPEAAQTILYLDSKTIQIHLKDDLVFHDGSPVTAADVAASFASLQSSRRVLRNVFGRIDSFEAKSSKLLLIHLKKPFPQILEALGAPNYAIFSEKFLKNANKDQNLWRAPVGCGGYRVVSYDAGGSEIRLAPVKSGLPVRFLFREGKALSPEERKTATILDSPFSLDANRPAGMEEATTFDPRQIYFVLNATLARWKTPHSRCGLFSRLSRGNLLTAYHGSARLASSLFPEGILGFSPLTRLPWLGKQDEMRPGRDGTGKFRLMILGLSVAEDYRPAYLEMLKNLAEQIDMTIMSDARSFGTKFLQSGADGFIIGFKSNTLDGYEFLLPFSEKTANFTGVFDTQLADLIRSSQEISSTSERAQLYQGAEKKILAECLVYPLLTLPARRVLVRSDWSYPGIGQVSINEYYLGGVGKK